MKRAGRSESSPNYSLGLWVPDLRAASLRLSGTTPFARLASPQLIYTAAHEFRLVAFAAIAAAAVRFSTPSLA